MSAGILERFEREARSAVRGVSVPKLGKSGARSRQRLSDSSEDAEEHNTHQSTLSSLPNDNDNTAGNTANCAQNGQYFDAASPPPWNNLLSSLGTDEAVPFHRTVASTPLAVTPWLCLMITHHDDEQKPRPAQGEGKVS